MNKFNGIERRNPLHIIVIYHVLLENLSIDTKYIKQNETGVKVLKKTTINQGISVME